ncbi:1-acyl-sn-glycerol-3-phosphate acyltransferase [Lactobacillus sp. ESL0677]|uniref:lysophospholipid acyltransferase family protein n=1 Tax=Lactobacillus sp. ESL0677 TaxID=2983208 RepID=UPI0023F9C9F7|nr:1-acyl-sn-glycerol-3-phosphate acyltransferase [Lactobacillus sp. ESL0677]WEV37059.1 1-acyl-sn-glycerol-3-phosphate acyltransferase [Lactobacillus sp. ESL0677]
MVKREYYYHNLTDDIITSHQQDYQLPDNYTIFPTTHIGKIWSVGIRPLAHLISLIYLHIINAHIIGKDKLATIKNSGYFIYANHTQPFGDAVMPLNVIPAKNYYVIAAQANWGIPILGKFILPYFGLPVGHNVKQFGNLIKAIRHVITANKVIVIYPEAHVWPYYTKIRPFSATSMRFPVKLNVPSFVMTTTYHHPRFGKYPHILVYLDGPFYPDNNLDFKHAQHKLHTQITTTMQKRATTNDYDYCTYHQAN